MELRIDDIRKTCVGILLKNGLSKEESEIIFDEYLEGELLGKKSHGLQAFPSLVKKLNRPRQKWEIKKETNSMIYIDAHGYFGQIIAKKAAKIICKKASKEGIGMAAISNQMTWLRPRTAARYIAESDMVGIVVNNGGSAAIAPTGGIDPMFGTNPIGIGIPVKDGMINFDMATSKRAWGSVRVAKALGHDLPDESFLKKDGTYASNPDDVINSAVPFGGYKGYALAMVIEILTGTLVNMPMGPRKGDEDYRTKTRGALMIAIDPSMTTDLSKFLLEGKDFLKKIKSSRRSDGIDEIIIPGEKSEKKKNESMARGTIEVDDVIWHDIEKMI